MMLLINNLKIFWKIVLIKYEKEKNFEKTSHQ